MLCVHCTDATIGQEAYVSLMQSVLDVALTKAVKVFCA